MKARKLLILILLADISSVYGEKIFQIRRNKNRNLVVYSVSSASECRIPEKNPVRVYWQMIEKSPTATENIGYFEQMAYGIDRQKISGNDIELTLKALPGRKIIIKTGDDNGQCRSQAWIDSLGSRARLKEVYVFAKEGFIKPEVQYIEIESVTDSGKTQKERVKP